MANFGILAKLGVDSSKMKAGLKKAGDQGSEFGRKLGKAVKAGAMVAGAAIAFMAAKGIKDFVAFEKKMAEVFTLMPEMTKEAEKAMSDDMRSLATTMGVDVIDATGALYQAISAGVPKENAADFLKIAAKAAIAGVSDLETSVAALTTIINGYGMEMSEATRVSDVMFSTVKIGVTNFTELGANIGKVTPLAAELGISIEEVGGMFAVLTKTLGAGKTAEAGTAIRSMLAEMSKEGMKAFENFVEASGTTFPNFIRAGGSVSDALKKMGEHAKSSGKGLMDMYRGVEAGMGALTLAKNETKDLADATKAIKEDAGSAETAYRKMAATTSMAFDQMKGKMKEAGMVMGELLLPIVNDVIVALSDTFEWLGEKIKGMADWFREHPELLTQVGKAIKLIAVGLIAYNAVAILAAAKTAILAAGMLLWNVTGGGVIKMLKALRATMMTNPFTALLTVVAMVVAAFVLWGNEAEEAAKKARAEAEEFADAMRARGKTAVEETKAIRKEEEKLRKVLADMNKEEKMRAQGFSKKKIALDMAKDALRDMEKELALQKMRPEMIKRSMAARSAAAKAEMKRRKDGNFTLMVTEGLNVAILEAKKKIADANRNEVKLTIAIKDQMKLIADLTEKAAIAEANRLKGIQQAKDLIEGVRREHELSQTTMGKIILLSDKLNAMDKERAQILANIAAGATGQEDAVKQLGDLERKRLKTQKEIADLMEGDLNKLRQEEIGLLEQGKGLLEAELAEQDKIIGREKQKLDLIQQQLDAQDKKVLAAKKEAQEAENLFAGNKFDFVTGERRGIGEFKLSSAKLHREFRRLRNENALPEGVKTFRQFQKHVEDGLREKKNVLAKEVQKQKDLQKQRDAADKAKAVAEAKATELKKEILAEEKKIIALRTALNGEEKKTLAQITAERIRLEDALRKFRNIAVGAQLPADPGIDRAMAGLGVKLDAVAANMQAVASTAPGTYMDEGQTFSTESGELIDLPDVEGDSETLGELQTQTTIAVDTLTALEGKFVNQPSG